MDTKKCHTYTAKLMMLYEGNCVRKKRKFTGAAALRGHGGAFVCVRERDVEREEESERESESGSETERGRGGGAREREREGERERERPVLTQRRGAQAAGGGAAA